MKLLHLFRAIEEIIRILSSKDQTCTATIVIMEDIQKIPANCTVILLDTHYITEQKENKTHLLPIRLFEAHSPTATIEIETTYLWSKKQPILIK